MIDIIHRNIHMLTDMIM